MLSSANNMSRSTIEQPNNVKKSEGDAIWAPSEPSQDPRTVEVESATSDPDASTLVDACSVVSEKSGCSSIGKRLDGLQIQHQQSGFVKLSSTERRQFKYALRIGKDRESALIYAKTALPPLPPPPLNAKTNGSDQRIRPRRLRLPKRSGQDLHLMLPLLARWLVMSGWVLSRLTYQPSPSQMSRWLFSKRLL